MTDSDGIVFFVDRCLGKNDVSNALREAGENVKVHDEHFKQDAPDTEWLPNVTLKGWIILTADAKIAKNKLEMLAVQESKARLFVLASGNLTGTQMGEVFTKARESIKSFVSKNPGPFIAKVYKDGTVKAWK